MLPIDIILQSSAALYKSEINHMRSEQCADAKSVEKRSPSSIEGPETASALLSAAIELVKEIRQSNRLMQEAIAQQQEIIIHQAELIARLIDDDDSSGPMVGTYLDGTSQ